MHNILQLTNESADVRDLAEDEIAKCMKICNKHFQQDGTLARRSVEICPTHQH